MFIRLLASDRNGEVIAAVEAMKRSLAKEGADFHTLADYIEKPTELSEADMKKLYDAGYNAGIRATESKELNVESFHNVDGTPAWHEIARFCQQNNDRLRENERTFVNDMAARTLWRVPTEKQEKWLRSIFYRLGGRL
jgi:hypothetical protein